MPARMKGNLRPCRANAESTFGMRLRLRRVKGPSRQGNSLHLAPSWASSGGALQSQNWRPAGAKRTDAFPRRRKRRENALHTSASAHNSASAGIPGSRRARAKPTGGVILAGEESPFRCAGKALTGHAIYKNVVQKYARQLGIEPRAICVHGLRATAATNALDHAADIAKVQEWLGHSSISTTRLYDRRKTKPEDSPTFKVSY